MRGFLAFGIAPDFSRELRLVAEALPAESRLRLLPLTDYHVTIKFLAEFSSLDFVHCLPELCALGKAPMNSVKAGRLALWATTLVLECEASAELVDWHRRVNALLERKGFLHERHPVFRPHITLARRKEGFGLPLVEAELPRVADRFFGRVVPLEAPALWKSVAEETGRRHIPLLSPLF